MQRLEDEHVRRLAEASAWRVALAEAEQVTTDEFEAWLESDRANGDAWDEVQASWGIIDDNASAPELLALRRMALSRAERRGAARWSSKSWIPRIAACLIFFIGIGALYLATQGGVGLTAKKALTYATVLGERRVVTLDDGSKVSLDSSSEVRIDYSADARKLVLLKGQARFDVAHDVTRPFTVRAGDRMVVATGTAFNVDLIGSRVRVTLIEGRVVVLPSRAAVLPIPGKPPKEGIKLNAGEQFSESAALGSSIENVSLERVTAWESGQLDFEDEPLGSIVGRVNRYSAQKLRADPAVAGLKITGIFNTGDVATFVDTVERYLPVKGVEQPDRSILLTRSGQS